MFIYKIGVLNVRRCKKKCGKKTLFKKKCGKKHFLRKSVAKNIKYVRLINLAVCFCHTFY